MMNLKLNQVALKLSRSLVLSPSNSALPQNTLKALVAEIAQLGFTFSPEALAVIKTYSQSDVKALLEFLIPELKFLVGGYVQHRPLFKNFPLDVPNEEEYLNSRLSYFFTHVYLHPEEVKGSTKLSCGHVVDENIFHLNLFDACPFCQMQVAELNSIKEERSSFSEKNKLKVINLITEADLLDTAKALIKSKVALNQNQLESLEILFSLKKNEIEPILPDEFFFKETMAFISKLILKHTDFKDKVASYLKTSTDVLRLAVALSEGDISLKNRTHFKLTSSERKFILTAFNNLSNPLEDCLRHRSKWLRLAEYLHVGAYKTAYPRAFQNIQILREANKEVPTFNRQAGEILKKATLTKQDVEFFASRPGEFLRKLDFLAQKAPLEEVLKILPEVAQMSSTPMLLQLSKHFSHRTRAQEFRAFIPKGQIASLYLIEGDTRKILAPAVTKEIIDIIEEELANRFAEKSKLTQLFISPALKNYLVPLTQRSSSKSLETIERGSQVKFDSKTKILRMFVYWKQPEGVNIDVDLSAVAYTKEWKYVTNISFHSLAQLGAMHSGDVRSAPLGASEFIDIPIEEFKKHNIRYVSMNVINFTRQTYNTFECFAGIMERRHAEEGNAFEPRSVKTKFDLTGDTHSNMPLLLDLEKGTLVWCDLALSTEGSNMAMGSTKQIERMGKYILSLKDKRPNLSELFFRHAAAHGCKVDVVKKPNTTYDFIADEESIKDIASLMTKWI